MCGMKVGVVVECALPLLCIKNEGGIGSKGDSKGIKGPTLPVLLNQGGGAAHAAAVAGSLF
jgi:hypothetical protein